jgi:hypothetical protein
VAKTGAKQERRERDDRELFSRAPSGSARRAASLSPSAAAAAAADATGPPQPPAERARPATQPPAPAAGRRRTSVSSAPSTAPSSISGRGFRRTGTSQSISAQAESITRLPWVGGCRSLCNVYLSSFLRVRDEQGRFLLCRSGGSETKLLEPVGVAAFPSSRVDSVLQAVERVATERGVRPLRNVEHRKLQGTELGTLGQVVLPVTLRAHVWADLQALDPLFEACRIPRKARQTGSDDIDNASARSLLMRGARSPLSPSDRVLRLTA